MKASFKSYPGKGQHFLVDPDFISRILDAAQLVSEDEVIEIGPGFGALTIPLTKRVSRVYAIEWDKRLVAALRKQLSDLPERLTIIQADVMDIDFLSLSRDFSRPPVVMGNLPYYLSTGLIKRLLPLGNRLNRMIFMMQKEVAERVTAKPGIKAYGFLSLMVDYFAEAQCLMDIPPHVFKPRPQVQSSVIRLKPRENPPVCVRDEQIFFQVMSSGFKHRRKTLINALKLDPKWRHLNIEDTCRNLGFERNVRAETLTLEDFVRLSNHLILQDD